MKRAPVIAISTAERRLLTAIASVALLFAVRALAPEAMPQSDAAFRLLAIVGKLALEACGAFWAWRVSNLFPGGAIRAAWRLLAGGLASFLAGQLVLADYQLRRGIAVPFPSPAEIFFLAAYPLLIAALGSFLRAYREAGWPLGEQGEDRRRMTVVAGLSLLAVLPTLQPIVRAAGPMLGKAINLVYPILDVLLLAPAALVLGVALRLHGGRVQRVWLALLSGVVLLVAGDIAFAYLTTLGWQTLDPIADILYLTAYGAFALAPLAQGAVAD